MKHRFIEIIACSTILLSGMAFAQSGLLGGTDGIHLHNAYTMGRLHFKIGTGGDIATDNWGYTRAGKFVDANGNWQQFDKWDGRMEKGRIDGALAGNFNFAVGVTDFWDVGVSLPLNYDHAKDYSGEAIKAHMVEGGLGDLEIWAKHQFPQFHDDDIWTLAAEANLTIPTGWKNVGLRPRHAWFLNGNGGNTYAYTADALVLGVHGIVSVDYTKKGLPLRWNSNLGFMVVFGDGSNTLVYGTGINYIAKSWLEIFLEFSGEMRLGNNDYPISPITDPMHLTPGFSLHLPWNIDFSAGLDIGVRHIANLGYDSDDEMDGCDDFMLQFDDGHGNKSHYCYTSGPLVAGTAKLTWRFGSDNSKDSDEDGVLDDKDQCPHTMKGIVVDSVGCPIDTDADGVFDGLDKCPNTPKGAVVDSLGCPLDEDTDGVFDGLDKCPNTLKGAVVDSLGCPIDTDADGVFDGLDQCPGTPKGVVVDGVGCPVDSDKDGVFDGLDLCPNTPEGATVDSVGCHDSDKDGVSELNDKCPNTLQGVKVDAAGCPLKKKQDLNQLKKGINFEFGSANLTAASFGTLNDIVALMKEFKNANLEVQGHTDIVGTEEFNQKLSEDRAHAVTDYLESKGIDSKRLRAKGFGTKMPIADNESDEGRAKNRRVELIPFEIEEN